MLYPNMGLLMNKIKLKKIMTSTDMTSMSVHNVKVN